MGFRFGYVAGLVAAMLAGLYIPSHAQAQADVAGWTVIFRSDDPLLWDKNAGDPSTANGYAVKLEKAPAKIRFVRLRRMDTQDGVIVRVTRDQLDQRTTIDADFIWAGGAAVRGPEGRKNKLLGIARQSWTTEKGQHLVARVPGKLDTGYRGWGFSKAANNNPDQTYSWAGESIDKTVFEIAVKAGELTDDEKALLLKSNGQPADAPDDIGRSRDRDTAGPTTKIARQQTSIKGLQVYSASAGQLGQAFDVILTATPGAPRGGGGETKVTYTVPAGRQMHMVLDDVVRSIRVKYPRWDAAKVEFSFSDKYEAKDGGSIGAALGTLILSMIEGFEIDPKLAITGDVSADGKLRVIGGVAAKLRGATAAQCAVMALPTDNAPQAADALVYDGPELFVNSAQVIGVASLTDAAALARVDRPQQLQEAIELFAEVQGTLKEGPVATRLRNADVRQKLSRVLELAPNHVSAKLLLAVADDEQPRKLSAGASIYYTSLAVRNVMPTLYQRAKDAARATATPAAVKESLKQLDKVRRIAAQEVIPLVDAWRDFIKAVSDVDTGRASSKVLEGKSQAVFDAMTKLDTNRELMEKMLNEGV
jgi:hypothetical protein